MKRVTVVWKDGSRVRNLMANAKAARYAKTVSEIESVSHVDVEDVGLRINGRKLMTNDQPKSA